MVKCSHLTVFLKDLGEQADNLNLSHTKVNIKKWISCMNRWQNNNPYGVSYSIFTEMIDQIVQPFTRNSNQLSTLFGNEIGFKQFCIVLNYNECLLNLNDSWENQAHRSAAIDFLIESFDCVNSEN